MKTQPSPETKRKMVEFFMKTSVPRIIAKKEQQKQPKGKEAS